MTGRPCTVCTSPVRAVIEQEITAGHPLTSVSSEHNVTRQSLQRHRDHHLAADVGIRDDGLSPFAVGLRLLATADRLHHLADRADRRDKLADATRSALAEAKTLKLLWDIELRTQSEADWGADVVAMERAVAALLRRAPSAGHFLADQLAAQGRDAYAEKIRAYAERCRDHRSEIATAATGPAGEVHQ